MLPSFATMSYGNNQAVHYRGNYTVIKRWKLFHPCLCYVHITDPIFPGITRQCFKSAQLLHIKWALNILTYRKDVLTSSKSSEQRSKIRSSISKCHKCVVELSFGSVSVSLKNMFCSELPLNFANILKFYKLFGLNSSQFLKVQHRWHRPSS